CHCTARRRLRAFCVTGRADHGFQDQPGISASHMGCCTSLPPGCSSTVPH
ncbi:MAG: hypothetical protein AVDCRST_MAG71-2729, partial [uncultured Lysobacter sp.]